MQFKDDKLHIHNPKIEKNLNRNNRRGYRKYDRRKNNGVTENLVTEVVKEMNYK